MKRFAFLFLASLLYLTSATRPPRLPSIQQICAAPSREPSRHYQECISDKLPQSVKATTAAVLECLGIESEMEFLDEACAAVSEGRMMEFVNALQVCGSLISPSPSQEDIEEAFQASSECVHHLEPYFRG